MPETTQFAGTENDNQNDGSLQANTVLLTRYKILGVLGGGGMGTVYQARDLNFQDVTRLVAIKEMQTLQQDPALRSSALKTFRREANILATLSHPAIPKIFDFFDLNDRAYLVMEYINGSDLELLLTKTKELPSDKIIEWAIDLCDVLHYLHSHKPEPIIFRDMKPSNVMIDSLGKVRLIDFGIAKTFVSGVKNTMIGTEGYSSPEQYTGDVNPLSDIYSLGATLHHILTRSDPRLAAPFTFHERRIDEANPKTPPALIAIVEKALAFDIRDRFQSALEMKTALEQLRLPANNGAFINISASRNVPSGSGDSATGFFDDMVGGTIEPKWTFTTEDEIRCSPVALNDTVYIGSYDTNVWALRLENGEYVWKYATEGGIVSSPILDDNGKYIFFGSEDYTFLALDVRNGRKQWEFRTKNRIRSTARLAHEHLFFGSDDGCVYALQAASGRKMWQYDTGAPVRCRPFVTNDLIIVGSESGEVIALELNGARKWSYRTKRGIISSPFVDMREDICYIGSTDGYLYALDANNGYSSWRFRTNGAVISSPVAQNGYVYFGSADGGFYSVNAQTGKEKWKFTSEKPIVASPLVYKNGVYFGSTDEYFYCIDVDSGKERWKFKTNGAITAAPYIADNLILIGSMDKTLYALPLVG